MNKDNVQQLYGPPLSSLPPATQVQSPNSASQKNITQFLNLEGHGINSTKSVTSGQIFQNVASKNTASSYPFQKSQPNLQIQPISTQIHPSQHHYQEKVNVISSQPQTTQTIHTQQGQQKIIQQQPPTKQIFLQQSPQAQHLVLQAQSPSQQIIVNQQHSQPQMIRSSPQPQSILVKANQQSIQQGHQVIVQQQSPQIIVQQQQPQQIQIIPQQVQQHQQIIHQQPQTQIMVQPPPPPQEIIVQQQPMTPIPALRAQVPQQIVPAPQAQVPVAPISLNLNEEGIFQLAQILPDLHSPQTVELSQKKQQINQFISPRNNEKTKHVQNNGSSLVARTLLGKQEQEQNHYHQQYQTQIQQQPMVIEKVTVVRDEKEVIEYQGRIKVLLDNVQMLNKTIDFKEQETQDLYLRLLEFEHLKRQKILVDEENEALKLQIQEWQKRYNVLELSVQDRTVSNYSFSQSSSQDIQKVLNTLKIKQEENEALKTTIARLELKQTSEKTLKEEIRRLNDLVELKNRQSEDWKNKYFLTEKNTYSGTAYHTTYLQPDILTSNLNTHKTNIFIHESSDLTRGITPTQYETSALFRRADTFSPTGTGHLNGVTSYLEDLRLNKNTQALTLH